MKGNKVMPKFKFVETEEIRKVVIFEAKSYEEAIDLMESARSIDDLPNVENLLEDGDTDWSEPEEFSEVA
jgi:hypothetical protein